MLHTRHAANGYGGWVKIMVWFRLYHIKPRLSCQDGRAGADMYYKCIYLIICMVEYSTKWDLLYNNNLRKSIYQHLFT